MENQQEQVNNEPITVQTISQTNLNKLNSMQSINTKKPLLDSIKDHASFSSKIIGFFASVIMASLFILEKLKFISAISTDNFVILPIIMIICAIIFLVVPQSINYLRLEVEKRLKNKKTCNDHELNEIQSILSLVNEKQDELSSCQVRSVMIKPMSICDQSPHQPNADDEILSPREPIQDEESMFQDELGNIYVKKVKF